MITYARIKSTCKKYLSKLENIIIQALGMIVNLFSDISYYSRVFLSWSIIVLGVCLAIYFLGSDILDFLKHGDLDLTTLGNLAYGDQFSIDYMIEINEWKGVGKILGWGLSLPSWLVLPVLSFIAALYIEPD